MSGSFVLASASPRRRELLTALDYHFEVVPSTVDEEAFEGGRPEALVRRLARAKAKDVAEKLPGVTVLAADTVVVLRRAVLNKPRDAAEAREMLGRLRDRWHRVITAVCLVTASHRTRVEHAVTRVRMRPYADSEVEASIARGDPFDKAGGYAIQDAEFAPVAAYEGCSCNVVGLPLWTARRLLAEAGTVAPPGTSMPAACDTCPFAPLVE
jgi:septum formation protein